VYLAEQVAKRLEGRNGVEVVLRHRELEKMEPEAAGTEKPEPERDKAEPAASGRAKP
jgi:hypothetical protein